jgi:hypothetical protein
MRLQHGAGRPQRVISSGARFSTSQAADGLPGPFKPSNGEQNVMLWVIMAVNSFAQCGRRPSGR